MTAVTIFRDKFAHAWPTHEHGAPGYVFDLGRTLARTYTTDAHFTAYQTSNGRRLSREALDHGVAVELGAFVFDVDCDATHGTPERPPEAWRRELRNKVSALAELHPGPYFYETRGGGRIVYAQPTPTPIRTHDDAKQWSRNYAVAVAYLARVAGIIADGACSDWQRFFRAPHATRERGGKPENWSVFGDPKRIGNLVIEPSHADLETAKRTSTLFREQRAREPSPLGVGGDGLFYHALRMRGHVGESAARGGWICVCPNSSAHSTNTDWTRSTIVVPPDPGHEIGLILCKHAHCWERFSVQQWLRMFSDSELEIARLAAGIKPRQRRAA
jgi:hypothetical protein